MCDVEKERAEEFARHFGIPEATDDWQAVVGAARHRRDRHRHALAHALRAGDRPRSRRASTCSARSRSPTTSATPAQRRRLARAKGLKTKLGFTFRYSPGVRYAKDADRPGLRRHAVHLQRLRAELAVARPADAAAPGRPERRSIGHPGLVAGGLWRADHRHRPLVGRRGLRAGRRHDAQLHPGADGARDGHDDAHEHRRRRHLHRRVHQRRASARSRPASSPSATTPASRRASTASKGAIICRLVEEFGMAETIKIATPDAVEFDEHGDSRSASTRAAAAHASRGARSSTPT